MIVDHDTLLNLRKTIQCLVDIPDEKIDFLAGLAAKKSYKRNEFFSTIEKPSTCFGYIAKGLTRSFIIDREGNEATLNFRGENTFTAAYGAIVLNNIQPIYIQALEDSEIFSIERDEFIKLWKTDAQWKDMLQIITEYDSLRLREREFNFLLYDAKTRYLKFMKDFHTIAERIKFRYVSSYLGISQETLSRIRTAPFTESD